ncbi:MAG: PQQ-binding-like beta-propeller repeat protein [Acidobacteriota bacterium]|nr:PQQ-binding-like beta-propeller repeat protein [Acidobacteriota bacterium]
MRTRLAVLAALLALPLVVLHGSASDERYWAQWRGPSMTGVSKSAKPPVEWSETKNIKWKVEIPGRGSASPVVWGDRLYVLTAVPAGITGPAQHEPRGALPQRGVHQYKVMAIDRATGKTVWERIAREEEPHEAAHQDNGSWASSSAVTDGTHLFAYFESRGLYAYDLQGKLLWQTDFGDKQMRNQFGEGSTPALHGKYLVVVWDHIPGPSFIVALDKATGKELWRTSRDEMDTWATPLVVEHAGRQQVIVNAMNRVRSYDLETGKIVWEGPGTTMNVIPSPVFGHGMVFVMSGFRGNNLKAIKLNDAKGDISTTGAIAWQLDRDTPYVPSPLLYDNILYFLKSNNGLLSAFDAVSGKPHYQSLRMAKAPEVFASPVGADGRVYIVSRDGVTTVIKHGTTYEVLAENTLDDGFDASPALVDHELYLRGFRYLYRIGM